MNDKREGREARRYVKLFRLWSTQVERRLIRLIGLLLVLLIGAQLLLLVPEARMLLVRTEKLEGRPYVHSALDH